MRVRFLLVAVLLEFLPYNEGRARLLLPPMRSSYWREGNVTLNAPVNFNDELLNCGGYEFQWQSANGKCGACGDPHGSFRENEYPGKYSTFSPQRTYISGQSINVTVYSLPNMLGWFEFRLCPSHDGPDVPDLHKCFEQNVLIIEETKMTRFYPGSLGGYSDMHVILPKGVTCDHCLLQWKYNTGYRTNRDPGACRDCLGCGPQEQYYNCADISILSTDSTRDPVDSGQQIPGESTASTTTVKVTTAAVKPTGASTLTTETISQTPEQCTPTASIVKCEAKGMHRLVPGIHNWCLQNCKAGKCREQFCNCYCDYTQGYKIQIDVSVFNRIVTVPSTSIGSPSNTTQKLLCYKPKPDWSKVPSIEGVCKTFCPGKWCSDMCLLMIC